jgi:hypothetical protein
MRRNVLLVAASGAVLAVLVTACTSSGSGAGGDANSGAQPAGSVPSAGGSARGAVPAFAGTNGGSGSPDVADVRSLTSTAEIRTAEITVAVHGAQHVAQQADEADAIAVREGGEITRDDRSSGKHASATVVLRVPPATLETTLDALAKLGNERSRQLSTVDVTQRVADVTSRVASAQAAIAQLRVLYRQASRVRDIIRIEQQLTGREADLESLQARQRALADETSLATITLQLVTAKGPPPSKTHHHRGGFVGGLERGWHGFVAAVSWLAVALGTVLPFLVVLLVAALAAWWTRRRLRRSVIAPPAPSE